MFWILSSVVLAAELPDLIEVNNPLEDRAQYLEEQVLLLEAEISNARDIQEHELQVLTLIRDLINSRLSIEQRVKSITQLSEIRTEMALPCMWEILGTNDVLDEAIVRSLPSFVEDNPTIQTIEECRQIISKALYLSKTEPSNFTVAIGGNNIWGSLDGQGVIREDIAMLTIKIALSLSDESIAELLYWYVQDPTVPMNIRTEAHDGLQLHFAEWMESRPKPNIEAPKNRLANNIYAVSTAVTGSVLLGSVGVWGQNETSETIGYTGGALLGATSGWLIGQEERPNLAQSILLASSTGWGLASGQMLASGFDLNQETTALFQTLGVSAGSGFGYWARNKNLALSDIIETDFMGYFGAQTAVALTDIIVDQSVLQEPDYMYYEAQGSNAYNQAYEDYNRDRQSQERLRQRNSVVGSMVGLGIARTVYPTWNPSLSSALFAGVWSGQMAIAASELLPAVGTEYPQGWVRLISHSSMAAAFLYDHNKDTTTDQSVFSAYGAGVGYLLGYGVNNLRAGSDDDGSRNAALLSTLGTIGGTSIGNQMDFSSSDWVTTGVGLGLSGWHLGVISNIASDNEWLTYDQASGLVSTGMGVASLGLLGTGFKYEISSSDAIFLGSSTAWGAYFGGLTPIALGIESELNNSGQLLITLLSSDLFLAAGSYSLMTNQFRSEQSAWPQIIGLSGATLGSLGAYLFTDSSQVVSGAALLGASAGLITGVILENKKPVTFEFPKKGQRNISSLSLQLSPYLDDQGDMGMFLGVSKISRSD